MAYGLPGENDLVLQCLNILNRNPFCVSALHPARQGWLPPGCFKHLYPGLRSFSLLWVQHWQKRGRASPNPRAGRGVLRVPMGRGHPQVPSSWIPSPQLLFKSNTVLLKPIVSTA